MVVSSHTYASIEVGPYMESQVITYTAVYFYRPVMYMHGIGYAFANFLCRKNLSIYIR